MKNLHEVKKSMLIKNCSLHELYQHHLPEFDITKLFHLDELNEVAERVGKLEAIAEKLEVKPALLYLDAKEVMSDYTKEIFLNLDTKLLEFIKLYFQSKLSWTEFRRKKNLERKLSLDQIKLLKEKVKACEALAKQLEIPPLEFFRGNKDKTIFISLGLKELEFFKSQFGVSSNEEAVQTALRYAYWTLVQKD